MEQMDGHQLQDFINNITLPPILRRMLTYRLQRQRQVAQIGDIWIPISPISPNHFNRFFIPSVEDLFQVGDQILKVDNYRSKSHLIS
jgi:hypothetical protein